MARFGIDRLPRVRPGFPDRIYEPLANTSSIVRARMGGGITSATTKEQIIPTATLPQFLASDYKSYTAAKTVFEAVELLVAGDSMVGRAALNMIDLCFRSGYEIKLTVLSNDAIPPAALQALQYIKERVSWFAIDHPLGNDSYSFETFLRRLAPRCAQDTAVT